MSAEPSLRLRRSRPRRHGRLAAAALSSAVLIVLFATPSRAELPPAAQAAVSQGLAAAQQQQLLVAIDRFQEARKLAPDAPELFGDLGLAESKIPGRELRAIAWFGAYLAAAPHAPNAVAVKAVMAELELKSDANRNRLIKLAWDAAESVPNDGNGDNVCRNRVPSLWALAGDMAAAMDLVERIPAPLGKVNALMEIAKAQVTVGDHAGARRTLLLAAGTVPRETPWLLRNVADAQLDAGEVSDAVTSAGLVTDPSTRVSALSDIARHLAEARDIPDAKAAIATALRVMDSVQASDWGQDYLNDLLVAQVAIVGLQLKIRDTDGAERTLSAARLTADRMPDWERGAGRRDLAGALADAGHVDEALKVAASIGQQPSRDQAFLIIAHKQAAHQDVAGAERTAGLVQDASYRFSTQPSVFEGEADGARTEAARAAAQPASSKPDAQPAPGPPLVDDWLKMLDYTLSSDPFPDLTGALGEVRSISDPHTACAKLVDTASTVIEARNGTFGMMARQAALAVHP